MLMLIFRSPIVLEPWPPGSSDYLRARWPCPMVAVALWTLMPLQLANPIRPRTCSAAPWMPNRLGLCLQLVFFWGRGGLGELNPAHCDALFNDIFESKEAGSLDAAGTENLLDTLAKSSLDEMAAQTPRSVVAPLASQVEANFKSALSAKLKSMF